MNLLVPCADDAAVQLIDETYSAALPPPASIIRRLICLSMCTESIEESNNTKFGVLRTQFDTPLRSRQRSRKIFARPTSTSIGSARRLLVQFAPHVTEADWMPASASTSKTEPSQPHVHDNYSLYASTPLAFWADVAMPFGFESFWDMLLGRPIPRMELMSEVSLCVPEFWMSPYDHAHTKNANTRNDEREDAYGADKSSCSMTLGAWRTLDALIRVWQGAPGSTFFAAKFVPIRKPLSIVFSFSTDLDVPTNEPLNLTQERATIAARLLGVLADWQAANGTKENAVALCQIAVQSLVSLNTTSLQIFCNVAKHIQLAQSICYMYLFMTCTNETDLFVAEKLYENGDLRMRMKDLYAMLKWRCCFASDRVATSKTAATACVYKWDMVYRCLWIQWWLLCTTQQTQLAKHSNLLRDTNTLIHRIENASSSEVSNMANSEHFGATKLFLQEISPLIATTL